MIGGHAAAVDKALAMLAERGVRKTVKLAVSVPSHTPLMREAANRLAEAMAGLAWHAPKLPVVQNVDAAVHDSIDAIRDALVRQLYLPVQWTGCVQALAATRRHAHSPNAARARSWPAWSSASTSRSTRVRSARRASSKPLSKNGRTHEPP